jgi:hypothetical protein
MRHNDTTTTYANTQVQRLLVAQDDLDATMVNINGNQQELDQTLEQLETQVTYYTTLHYTTLYAYELNAITRTYIISGCTLQFHLK